MAQLSENLFLFRDTCHVYVIRSGTEAVLVDFGDGEVLYELPGLGIEHVSDILITHHHRDQTQGLSAALAADGPLMKDTRVWVPHTEQDLFHSVDLHWQSRPLLNNYDVRQDRFSLLNSISLAGTLKDYACYTFGERTWQVIPTPGHTPGSLSLFTQIDGQRVAFTGDLIAGPGKVWSMSALQWSYQLMEGAATAILSLEDVRQRDPQMLLPSHGEIMPEPSAAIDLLIHRLRELLDARQENMQLMQWLHEPYIRITPHLLRNRTSVANSYVLLSDSGKALLIDYGYDFLTSIVSGPDRAWHRPWLYNLPALKRDFGVTKIDVVVATHYHDDHVAGFNLLRDVEGTQVWAADTFADILKHPNAYNLPCLWYDPIPVDRVMPSGQAMTWEEYTLTAYPLSGHTRYAVAIAFEVDSKRVLATGDQYKGVPGTACNYVYQNGFDIRDYVASAELYRALAPDLVLSGHWTPLWVDEEYLTCLHEQGETVLRLHKDLLPLDTVDMGAEGFAANIQPYHWSGAAGHPISYQVQVHNPLPNPADLIVRLALPAGWQSQEPFARVHLSSGAESQVQFQVIPPSGLTGRRFRLSVDLTAGDLRLGQQAEALVDLV